MFIWFQPLFLITTSNCEIAHAYVAQQDVIFAPALMMWLPSPMPPCSASLNLLNFVDQLISKLARAGFVIEQRLGYLIPDCHF
jgi:hypothetical protein